MPTAKMFEDRAFDRAGMEKPNPVHGALLAETIDAANALLETKGIPRQLDIDDEAAPVMQIQPLARGIGCNQHIDAPAIERIDSFSPVIRREASVNEAHTPRRHGQGGDDRVERVAEFREDQGRARARCRAAAAIGESSIRRPSDAPAR
jgi:hypothetical protein